jgi:signal peptidase II
VNEVSSAPVREGRRQVLVPVAIGATVVAIDQITKWLVADRLGPEETTHRHDVLGDFLAIHYVENRGVAFGLFQGQAMIATVLAVIVLALLIRTYRRADDVSWQIVCGGGLIVGGAIGNIADRMRLGYVVDFVAVSAWPKFNVADSAITIGVLLLAWRYFVEEGREGSDEKERNSTTAPGLVLLRHDGDR